MEELLSKGDWAPEAFQAVCFEVFITFCFDSVLICLHCLVSLYSRITFFSEELRFSLKVNFGLQALHKAVIKHF